jgi:hypothetical protein
MITIIVMEVVEAVSTMLGGLVNDILFLFGIS